MEYIVLPEQLRRQMLQHAEGAAPLEAVGLVGGDNENVAHLVIELPNLAGKDEFFADPFAQFQAERRISDSGLKILAIYHSHPGGCLQLSDADLVAAAQWNCAQIVIVPERYPKESEYLRCYRVLDKKEVVEIKIEF